MGDGKHEGRCAWWAAGTLPQHVSCRQLSSAGASQSAARIFCAVACPHLRLNSWPARQLHRLLTFVCWPPCMLPMRCPAQAQRKLEAAESRASSASARVTELTSQLGGAEDQIVALEGHISVMEEELAKYTELPQ